MTPDEQTVERVAKAMAFDRRSPLDASEDDNDFWAHTGEQAKDDWRGTARAAISAMPDTKQARNDALREAAEHACAVIDAHSEYDQNACCDGRECSCGGETVHDHMKLMIRRAISENIQ